MDVGEIVDRESLEAWLNSLPQDTKAEKAEAQRIAALIAHRAAMRVLPANWSWMTTESVGEPSEQVLAIFRSNFMAVCLYRTLPDWNSDTARILESNGHAASAAASVARSIARFARGNAAAISVAVDGAVAASESGQAEFPAHLGKHAKKTAMINQYASAVTAILASCTSANAAAKQARNNSPAAISSAATAFSSAIVAMAEIGGAQGGRELVACQQEDCQLIFVKNDNNAWPLWFNENPLASLWSETRKNLLAQGPGWHFWVTWYDKALNGTPQDWPLLTKIALIDPKDWQQGAGHVNALIAEIRLNHLAETRPLGEDSIAKGADGLWHRTGRSGIDRDILQDARGSVLDVIHRTRDRLHLTNSLTALAPELDLLDRALTRYPDRPLRLHDTFLHVQSHIARDLASGELPDDHIVHDLTQVMGTAALDMRNACPNTRAVIEARIATRFAEAGAPDRATLSAIARAGARISDLELAAEFIEDAQVLEETLPPAESATSLYHRLTTRLAVMVTRDGGNILKALKEIDAIGGGLTTLSALTYFLLRFIL